MHFQLRRDANAWFQKIDGIFKLDFDKYYLCAMVGIAAAKHTVPKSDLKDITDTFPQDWSDRARLIIGLLISTHLRQLGVSLDERESVNEELKSLLNPDSPTKLSDQGMRLLNGYASGGFDVLVEKLEKPYTAETFLRSYARLMKELCNKEAAS